ncbi:MAG: Mu-like prophage major head subunit gpT family protein [Jannaschia sp.]
MRITATSLDALRVGFNSTFQEGFATVISLSDQIAEPITSTTESNLYGWLAELPSMREWVGPRVVNVLSENDYRLKNKDWEQTVGVDRNYILDDNLGTTTPRFRVMGRSTALWREQLVWAALAAGFTAECYDGQPFFDTAHPVIDEEGTIQPVSNVQAGAGPAWFLMATNGPVKPIIRQIRKEPEFVAMDKPDDPNVFMNRQFIYGTDARGAAGYGFWQTCVGSKAALTPANYEAARTAITSMKGDHGNPLGLVPNLLVVPPTLEGAANKIVKNALVDGGNTNEWAGTADVLMVPYLS